MIHRTSIVSSKRELLHVAVAGTAGQATEAQSRDAIARAVAEVELAGIPAGHIVRSRLWGRDAEARQIASNVRLEILGGLRRGASSSFVDGERLPAGIAMMIELYALRSGTPADAKKIVEYAPPIAPPMLVVLDGLLVLSGDTDRSDGIEAQMASIRGKLDASLAAGGGRWDQVVSMSVFMAKRLAPGFGRAALSASFPGIGCPVTISTVDGYSHPETLVEIEVTADLGKA